MESLATLDVWENRALLRHDMATFRRSPVPFMHDSDDEEDEDDDDYVDYDVSNRSDLDAGTMVRDIPALLQENGSSCIQEILPKVKELLCVAEAELHLTACSTLLTILQHRLVPVHKYSDTFLTIILNNLDSKDSEIAAAWLSTLLDVIDLLPKDIISREVLSVAVQKGQLSDNVMARMACCRLLGKLASQLDLAVLRSDVLPLVQSLCHDVDGEVRMCMCQHLPAIARALGEAEVMRTSLLTELVELADDEDEQVRCVSLDTVLAMLHLVDNECLRDTMVPLVMKCCRQAVVRHDITLPFVAARMADMCHALQDVLSAADKRWLFDTYKTLCLQGFDLELDIDCRILASQHFTEMLTVAQWCGWQQELVPVLMAMSCDHVVDVRANTASCLHEVLQAGVCDGPSSLTITLTLLHDSNIEVVSALVIHLVECLQRITTCSTITSERLAEVASGVLRCRSTVLTSSRHWRLQEQVAQLTSHLPSIFLAQHQREMFTAQLVDDIMHARAKPVRRQLVIALLSFLRSCSNTNFCNDIVNRIVKELAQSSSCFKRQLFIVLCEEASSVCGQDFVVHNLLSQALTLTHDPISNVRLAAVRLLPQLKRAASLSGSSQLVAAVDLAVTERKSDESDMDVIEALDKAVKEMNSAVYSKEKVTDYSDERVTSAPGDNKVTSSSSDLRVITSPVDNRLTGSKRVIARVSPAIKPPLSPASDKQDTRTRRPRSQLPRKGKLATSHVANDATSVSDQCKIVTIGDVAHSSADKDVSSNRPASVVLRRSTLPVLISARPPHSLRRLSTGTDPQQATGGRDAPCGISNGSGNSAGTGSTSTVTAPKTRPASGSFAGSSKLSTSQPLLSRPASGTPVPLRKTTHSKSPLRQHNSEPVLGVVCVTDSAVSGSKQLQQPTRSVSVTRLPQPSTGVTRRSLVPVHHSLRPGVDPATTRSRSPSPRPSLLARVIPSTRKS